MTSNQLPIHSYDEDIRDLTAAIEQLRLAQARLDTVVTIVERNIDRRVTQEEPARTQETRLRTRRRAVHPSASFVVGDYVKIKNPRQGQPDRGIVFGATRSTKLPLDITKLSIVSFSTTMILHPKNKK